MSARQEIYVDATFDYHTGSAVIGWINEAMTQSGYRSLNTTSIHEAEFLAIELAITKWGIENIHINSDSTNAITKAKSEYPDIQIDYVNTKHNLADTLVSIVKEDWHRIRYYEKLKKKASIKLNIQ